MKKKADNNVDYQLLVDNANEIVQSIGPNGEILYVNKKWKKLLGYSDKEISKLNLFNILRKDQHPHCQKLFSFCKKGKDMQGIETVFVGKKGQEIPVRGNVSPLMKGKKFISTSAFFTDIRKEKEKEKELLESKKEFISITSNVPGLVYRCKADKNWTMLLMNDQAKIITGYPASDFIQNKVRTFSSIIHRDDQKMVEKAVSESLKSKFPYTIDYRIINKNGKIIWVYEKGSGVFDKNGKLMYLDGVIIDNSEKKEIENKIRKFERIIEQTPNLIIMTDNSGNIEYVNPAFENITHYSYNEVIGKNPKILKSGKTSKSEYKDLWKKITKGKSWNGEFNNIKKDGSNYWASAQIFPIKDKNNNITNFVGIQDDITKSKENKEELQRLKDQLELQIKEMPIGLIVWDTNFKVKTWNPAAEKIFGFKEKDAIGKHPYGLIVPKEAQPIVDKIWNELIKKNIPNTSVNENNRKDGKIITCSWSNVPLKKPGEKSTGILSMVQDITEKKEMEEKYKLLFDSSRDAIMTLEPPKWLFTSGNKATVELFNCKDEKHFTSFAPPMLSPPTQPDGKPSGDKAIEMIQKAMKEGSNFLVGFSDLL